MWLVERPTSMQSCDHSLLCPLCCSWGLNGYLAIAMTGDNTSGHCKMYSESYYPASNKVI